MTAASRLRAVPILGLVAVLALAGCASDQPSQRQMDAAQDVFKRFVDMSNVYDKRVAELYDDDARVILLRPDQPLDRREVVIKGREFKQLLRKVLPKAAERGQQSRYSKVSYKRDGDRVMIEATRRSLPDGAVAPHILVVGPSEDGVWRIHREVATTT